MDAYVCVWYRVECRTSELTSTPNRLTNTHTPQQPPKQPTNRLPPLSKFYMRYMALGAFIVIVAAWQK